MPSGVYIRKPGSQTGKFVRSPEYRRKLSESMKKVAAVQSKDPEWRSRVSAGTSKRMRDPDVRQKHLDGLQRAFAKATNGNNFKGGQGQPSNELEDSYSWLVLAGYQRDYPIQICNGLRYRLDYALVEEKICFEIDGSSHKRRQQKDAAKDTDLHALGWTVIRIRHW